VAEGARLESVYTGNRIVGSNPTPSARIALFRSFCLLSTSLPKMCLAVSRNLAVLLNLSLFQRLDTLRQRQDEARIKRSPSQPSPGNLTLSPGERGRKWGNQRMPRRVHGMHRLSPTFVRRCTKPGVYFDGGGLRFRVYPNKTRLWVMRIVAGGRRRDISLGAFPAIPLADARSQAEVIRKAVAQGHDPTPQKRPAEALSSHPTTSAREDERPTFEQCWRAFWAAKEPQLSNGKHRDQWVMTMKTYVLPYIGHRPVADVTPSEVIQLLSPIWHAKEETARRVLQTHRCSVHLGNHTPATGEGQSLPRCRP
jgi:Arm DNA-binding domain